MPVDGMSIFTYLGFSPIIGGNVSIKRPYIPGAENAKFCILFVLNVLISILILLNFYAKTINAGIYQYISYVETKPSSL